MSPIPSVATSFALYPTTPAIALDPDSTAQSASGMTQHLLGTGGLLFGVVALVSLAGYFYHRRGAANTGQTSNTWVPFTSLLSSMRPWGSSTNTGAAGTDGLVDLEFGFERHVNMVYARYFHPTFWKAVECHPATPSAPAIYVEEEANEIPAADPTPHGMNSFLDVDDDDGDSCNGVNPECKKQDHKLPPPYDTSAPINVNFNNTIIGATIRLGTFLSVPGELDPEEDTSENAHSEDDLDFDCSPYDGIMTSCSDLYFDCPPYVDIVTPPPGSSFATRRYGVADMAHFSQSLGHLADNSFGSDSEIDFDCSPYDGIVTTDSESDVARLPYDDIATTPPRSSFDTWRRGAVNMAGLSEKLDDAIPNDGYDLVATISPPTGLFDLASFVDRGTISPCMSLDQLRPMHNDTTAPNHDIGVHDIYDTPGNNSSGVDTVAVYHEGQDLMRKLLAELRDPAMDCNPRPLSEDSDSEYSDDDDEAETSIPYGIHTQFSHDARQDSSEPTPWTDSDSDTYDERSDYPFTPPSKFSTGQAGSLTVHLDGTSTTSDERVLYPMLAWSGHEARRNSLESMSTPGTNSDLSEGHAYPLTPPPQPFVSLTGIDLYEDNKSLPIPVLQAASFRMSPTFADSPVVLPAKAYVRSHRDSRSLYGPRMPVARLPRL